MLPPPLSFVPSPAPCTPAPGAHMWQQPHQLAGQRTPVVGQLMVMLSNNRDQLCHPAYFRDRNRCFLVQGEAPQAGQRAQRIQNVIKAIHRIKLRVC